MSPATLWDPAAERRRYVQKLLRATATKLASGDPDMRVYTRAVVTPLDADGNPVGRGVDIGPVAMSMRLTPSLAD